MGASRAVLDDESSEEEGGQVSETEDASHPSMSQKGDQDDQRSTFPDGPIAADPMTPGDSTPSDQIQEGMLPRDMERKTPHYSYAAEKQLSQTDAKMFYQRTQLDAQRTGGSQYSPEESPQLRARGSSNLEQGNIQRTGSTRSLHSGIVMTQKLVKSMILNFLLLIDAAHTVPHIRED